MNKTNSLLSRAAALSVASKTILPLACAATASAATLNFDYFGTGMFDNSGWFISTLTTPAIGGGITQGLGFKLYGSDSMSDSAFYYYDSFYEQTVPRYDGDGMGLLWGGTIDGAFSAGDVLSAPYEFSYTFTHTPAFSGDTYISNPWKLEMGLLDRTGLDPMEWASGGSGLLSNSFTRAEAQGYNYERDGIFNETGNLSLAIEEWDLQSYTPTHWYVRLTVLLEHENALFDTPPYDRWNGDTLTVTVPQNSIDLTYTPIPESSAFLLTAVSGLLIFRRRRNF